MNCSTVNSGLPARRVQRINASQTVRIRRIQDDHAVVMGRIETVEEALDEVGFGIEDHERRPATASRMAMLTITVDLPEPVPPKRNRWQSRASSERNYPSLRRTPGDSTTERGPIASRSAAD